MTVTCYRAADIHGPDDQGVLLGITAITAQGLHSLALRSDGTVWAWGLNNAGVLGDGTQERRATPVQALGVADSIAIATGQDFSMALVASPGSAS